MNHLVALSPTDLAPAQASLTDWCDQRIAHWKGEEREASAQFKHAVENKWGSKPFARLAQKAARKVLFYSKVKEAIALGYLIVPNFPLEIFAIRTNAEFAKADSSSYRHDRFEQTAKALPQGDGQYMNPIPLKESEERPEKDGKTKTYFFPTEMRDELEVPFHLVKPAIMRAVDAARAHKLFDQIGICTDRKADPIVCGQILEDGSWGAKRVTFFLAWYVDLDSI